MGLGFFLGFSEGELVSGFVLELQELSNPTHNDTCWLQACMHL